MGIFDTVEHPATFMHCKMRMNDLHVQSLVSWNDGEDGEIVIIIDSGNSDGGNRKKRGVLKSEKVRRRRVNTGMSCGLQHCLSTTAVRVCPLLATSLTLALSIISASISGGWWHKGWRIRLEKMYRNHTVLDLSSSLPPQPRPDESRKA
ncbi:hypothetical protein PoB_007105600 [Plakobranchus ocellatus]|uniref:Uncharacterized protein n=1 Tax=Plakobranchus ocellatus TaxID=259542 RepID=A0AAV4DL02_9GAST|nr:hypothetical protein PoB_007105600 [Plakobranchus ocellatus]